MRPKTNTCPDCGAAIDPTSLRCVPCAHAARAGSRVRYIPNPETGCWDWQRSVDGHGYGQIRARGRTLRAHRVIYEEHRGPIPAGLDLDHVCQNVRCVNPDHLEPVTHRENIRRGRMAKLTAAEVATIRALKDRMAPLQIAERFGVSRVTVYNIFGGWTWRDVAPASDDHD